jgi:hypothetical protein
MFDAPFLHFIDVLAVNVPVNSAYSRGIVEVLGSTSATNRGLNAWIAIAGCNGDTFAAKGITHALQERS